MSEMPRYAGAEDLFGQTKVRYRDVPVPEIGKTFRIRSLSELEKSRYEAEPTKKPGKVNRARLVDAKRRLICLCLVDEVGNRILGDGDVEKLAGVDSLVTSRLFDACFEHCGFGEGDSIEEMVGNSAGIPDDDSPTD